MEATTETDTNPIEETPPTRQVKIRSAAQEETLKRAREKALQIRKENAELKKKEKLVLAEKEKVVKQTKKHQIEQEYNFLQKNALVPPDALATGIEEIEGEEQEDEVEVAPTPKKPKKIVKRRVVVVESSSSEEEEIEVRLPKQKKVVTDAQRKYDRSMNKLFSLD